jgi:alkaline phosphatase D
MLDGRQYRTPQACPRAGRGGANVVGESCRELFDPERTMLSTQQERWLDDGVRGAADRWKRAGPGHAHGPRRSPPSAARSSSGPTRGTATRRPAPGCSPALRDRDARSCVVISGDAHATFAADLRQDAGNEDSPVVATEVCGTSITSQGRPASQIDTLLRENPDIHYADASRRGLHGPRHHAGGDPGGGPRPRRRRSAHDRGQHRRHVHRRTGPARHPA